VFYLCEQFLSIWVIQECVNFTVDYVMTAASLLHEFKVINVCLRLTLLLFNTLQFKLH